MELFNMGDFSRSKVEEEKEPEKIAYPIVRYKGKEYLGMDAKTGRRTSHADAWEKLIAEHGELSPEEEKKVEAELFRTSRGQIIGRKEADDLALQAFQLKEKRVKGEAGVLHSEDIREDA